MKKIICMLFSLVIAVSFSVPVFAASGINSAEKAILNKLDTKIVSGKFTIQLDSPYKNQAYNYMLKDGVDLTQAQSNEIIGKVDECITIVDNANVSSISKLTVDQKNTIIRKAQESASVIGLTLSYDSSSNTAILKDKNGVILSQTSNVIKVTGMSTDTMPLFVTTSVLAVLLLSCSIAIVVLKKRSGVK